MASTIGSGQMIFQDENAMAHGKRAVAGGKGKISLAGPKKNGAGFGSRKALHDITNKSKIQPKASSKTKNNVEIMDLDIAKEGFLHDHSKCIEEQQQYQWDSYFSEHIMLHGHDIHTKVGTFDCSIKEMDDENSHSWDETIEIPMEEFSGLLDYSTQWRSPPDSPLKNSFSLPSSPLPWHFETVEFKLKDDDYTT